MDSSQPQKSKAILSTLLIQSQNIGIVVGAKPDIDLMAAGLSFYLSLKSAGKNVQIICPTDPLVEIANLVGIDKVKKSFDGTASSISIVVPFKKFGIEKVTYNKEGEKLILDLIGGENGIQFNESEVEYLKKGSAPSVIVSIGVSSLADLDHAVGSSSEKVINIDNTGMNEGFGDVVIVDPMFSSRSEVIAKILRDFALPVDQDIAQNLLDGINQMTNNFTSVSTSPLAFESAGFLMRKGAKRKAKQEEKVSEARVTFENLPKKDVLNEEIVLNDEQDNSPAPRNNQQQNPRDNQRRYDNRAQKKTDKIPSDWFVPKVYKGSKKHN